MGPSVNPQYQAQHLQVKTASQCSVVQCSKHAAENEPSGFNSKHLIFFPNISICRLLSYNLNFQKLQKSSAFLSLISIVSVGSKINQDYSVFFCDIFGTVEGRVPKFCEFSLTIIRHVSAKKSNCIIAQSLPKKHFFRQNQ